MRKFNLRFLAFISAIIFLTTSCVTTKLPESYKTTPQVLEMIGGKIDVNVQATIPAKAFNPKDKVEFTPVLKYGGQEKQLKTLTLVGDKFKGEGDIIYKKTGGTLKYSDVIKYDPAMDVSELVVAPKLYKKGKTLVQLPEVKLADGVIHTSDFILHDEDLLHADRPTAQALNMDVSEYYDPVTFMTKEATIWFIVNRYDLNLKMPLNKDPKAIAQLKAFTDFMAQGWKIKSVDIDAWASPEGEETYNENLSLHRAQTGDKYFVDMMKTMAKQKDTKVTIKDPDKELMLKPVGHGPDWDGFVKAVDASTMKEKNTILNVVRSQPDVNKREKEIRNMTVIFEELEKSILPPLRRALLKVTCYEPKKTNEEIARLAITDPTQLTDKELLFAGTLTDNLDTKMQIYKKHMSLYPNDWKGYNNAAWVYLMEGNAADAMPLLEKANQLRANNPIILNNLGATASKSNDFAKAETDYTQAKNLGAKEDYNMGMLLIPQGEFDKALNMMAGKKCNYNIALARMIKGDNAGADSELSCATDNAQTFYLRAVLGARMSNTTMLYGNLKSAISAAPAYKEMAAKDREFLKYFKEPDFMNAVK
jgi:Flp pilus assembly protein TadD